MNEGSNKSMDGADIEWSAYQSKLSDMEATNTHDFVHMWKHRKFTVDCDSEITHLSWRCYPCSVDELWLVWTVLKPTSSSEPYDFSFVRIKSHSVAYHPILDLINAIRHHWNQQGSRRRVGMSVYLQIDVLYLWLYLFVYLFFIECHLHNDKWWPQHSLFVLIVWICEAIIKDTTHFIYLLACFIKYTIECELFFA